MDLRPLAFWILSGFAMAGCSGKITKVSRTTAPAECRVIRWVYHHDWVVCGEITVFAGRKYCFRDYNIWTSPPTTNSNTGTLPSDIYRSLMTDSRSFPVDRGVPTYGNYIDDHHHKRPAGVE